MFNLPLPDKETAMLILYYAKRGAEAHTSSLIEAPKIVELCTTLLPAVRDGKNDNPQRSL